MLTPYAGVPGVRALFALAEEELGFDLWTLCQTGPQERLNDTAVSQPAVLLTSLAAALKLLHDEVRSVGPVIPVGRSVGRFGRSSCCPLIGLPPRGGRVFGCWPVTRMMHLPSTPARERLSGGDSGVGGHSFSLAAAGHS